MVKDSRIRRVKKIGNLKDVSIKDAWYEWF